MPTASSTAYNQCLQLPVTVLSLPPPLGPCRREGNRKAAARLRAKRQQTLHSMQSRCSQLESECSGYASQIRTLLEYCRSILSESAFLRLQLQMVGWGVPSSQPLEDGMSAEALLKQVGVCPGWGLLDD